VFPEKLNTEIEQRMSSDDFRRKTQQQIAKDFSVYGYVFALEFQQELQSIERLKQYVQDSLLYILEKQPSSWHPLLYTIDISETIYLQLATSGSANWMEEFSWLVIRREAQKVFFREQFSK
jgi:hypothetical protein